jgi:hypothetical protein
MYTLSILLPLRMKLLRLVSKPQEGGVSWPIFGFGFPQPRMAKPRPLPRPLHWRELVTREATVGAVQLWLASNDLTVASFEERFIEALFHDWVRRCGATPEEDGDFVDNLGVQHAWRCQAEDILDSEGPRKTAELREIFQASRSDIIEALCKSPHRERIKTYLLVAVLPYFLHGAEPKAMQRAEAFLRRWDRERKSLFSWAHPVEQDWFRLTSDREAKQICRGVAHPAEFFLASFLRMNRGRAFLRTLGEIVHDIVLFL